MSGDHAWSRTPEVWPEPLTIGVVADTHCFAEPPGQHLPAQLLTELARASVGLIVHAGDIFAAWVLDELQTIAPVLAVVGNGDTTDLQQELPRSRVIEVGRHHLGLVHGHQGRGRTTLARARSTFADNDAVRCVIFGHSHQPLSQLHGETICFNPGSPTDKRWQPYYSFGLLRVTETIAPELVYFL